MSQDFARVDRERLAEVMRAHGLDALICRLPQNVVLLSGYFPVLGGSFCVVASAKDGPRMGLAVPADEADLVRSGAVATVETFQEETLDFIGTTLEVAGTPLAKIAKDLGISGTVGYEGWPAPAVSAYTQVGVPGPETLALYRRTVPGAQFRDASDALLELASIKNERQIQLIEVAIETSRHGFIAARQKITPGHTEADVAAAFLAAVYPAGFGNSLTDRLIPHVHVMSGPRAALAFQAYNLTSNRVMERGDTVLVQMELSINGYWAELSRTFFAGEVSDFWTGAHKACVEAQDQAIEVERDGARGADVDMAARQVMKAAGLGKEFKHGLGHGVGLQAINHSAAPILHPASNDSLRSGMVHNMEPAVYVDGSGGVRLNDDVLVGDNMARMLSDSIPRDLGWLVTGR